MRWIHTVIVSSSIALAACALNQPPPSEELRAKALPNVKTPVQWASQGGAAAASADNWLASFNDPALDAMYARQSIAAQTAKAYFVATEAQLQLAIAKDTVLSSERMVGFARDRLRVGKGDEYDVATGLANLDTYHDVVAQLELARSQALRALETLIGRYPAGAVDVPTRFAATPPPVP